MTTTVDVHRLRPDELDAVIDALTDRPAATHRRRAELQMRGRFRYLIAWIDGVPVGHVGLGLVDDRRIEDVCEWRGFALVSDLEVMPTHRRLGAGRALMEALEAEALGVGMPGVALDTGTEESFAEARGLYHSMGYVDRGEVFLGGWSDPLVPGRHFVDPLTQWFKRF
jgi:GNAT superfamily N-acetyltransferase